MKNEKKEFQQAEVEVVRFKKNDVIITSTSDTGVGYGEDVGD